MVEEIRKKIEQLENKKLEGIIEKEALEKDIATIDSGLGKLHMRVNQLNMTNADIRKEISKLENALEVIFNIESLK